MKDFIVIHIKDNTVIECWYCWDFYQIEEMPKKDEKFSVWLKEQEPSSKLCIEDYLEYEEHLHGGTCQAVDLDGAWELWDNKLKDYNLILGAIDDCISARAEEY